MVIYTYKNNKGLGLLSNLDGNANIEETILLKKKMSKNRIIIISVIAIILIFVSFLVINNSLKAKKAEQYKQGMADTAIIMYESWGEIETTLDAYELVWDLAIEVDVDDWQSYVSDLVDGMNEASGEQLKIDRNKLEKKIGRLSNPPEEYKESYKIIKNQYRIYVKGYEQLKEPTGSLNDFQNNTSDFKQEFNSLKADFKTTFENGQMRKHIEDGVEKLNEKKKDSESGVDDVVGNDV
jgi:hypothetical protein